MQDDEIKILAPTGGMTRRRAMVAGAGGLASLFLAACGGKSSSGGGGNSAAASGAEKLGTKIESGPLLMANWPDYVDPAHYKAYT